MTFGTQEKLSVSENKEPMPGKEIQVWVWQEEKIVCGVTKHTTCEDVVQALLDDHRTSPDGKTVPLGDPAAYCLLERWKGFERALPPLTRILRLWSAWGEERPFVQFVLVKASEYRGPQSSKESSRPKGALCKSKSRSRIWDQAPAQYVRSLPVEKQKRMVKKAFRKLEKIKDRERALSADESGISGLVQLIITQDHTIRQQIHRMRELDLEIKHIERGLRADGVTARAERPNPHHYSLPELANVQAESGFHLDDGVDLLELQLKRHRDLIEKLSHEIDAEIRTTGAEGGEPQGATASEEPSPEEPMDGAELDRLRRELENSMYRGLTLHTQLSHLEKELEQNDLLLRSKSQECEGLAEQLSSLCLEDSAECLEQGASTSSRDLTRTSSSQSKLQQVLSQKGGSDTDSDTGISSTHSQDSLSPCRDIRPPLDTDL
ncbi:hypothetical protein JZ751_016861 [Albula glossodonta]|uniref:Ras-associating domain-containing protein n=1 Tax=Albula glossodonta TaxID=121402 RepID=A0A8T2NQ39_9TELE|nr:hypothetical protein JZ751_016861 [Albula glossodonta]